MRVDTFFLILSLFFARFVNFSRVSFHLLSIAEIRIINNTCDVFLCAKEEALKSLHVVITRP